jgi:hypothetical protein
MMKEAIMTCIANCHKQKCLVLRDCSLLLLTFCFWRVNLDRKVECLNQEEIKVWTKKDGEFEADVVMLVNIYDTKGGFIFKQTHGAQALVYYQWECLRGSLHVIQEKMANYLPPFQFKCIFFGIIIINSFNIFLAVYRLFHYISSFQCMQIKLTP